jgi:hypothetical protein
MSGDTSANNSKKLYTPAQSAFQTQGGEQIRARRPAGVPPTKQGGGGRVGVCCVVMGAWGGHGVGVPIQSSMRVAQLLLPPVDAL